MKDSKINVGQFKDKLSKLKKKNRDIAFGIPHILHTLDECVEQEC